MADGNVISAGALGTSCLVPPLLFRAQVCFMFYCGRIYRFGYQDYDKVGNVISRIRY